MASGPGNGVPALLFAALAVSLCGQQLESVSVKPSGRDGACVNPTREIPRQTDPARIDYFGVSLKAVISHAYGVDPDQVSGPRWLDDDRFDISGALPPGATREEIPSMLRRLLADHFSLVTHEQTKPRSFYALTAGKGQLRMAEVEQGKLATIDLMSDHLQLSGYSMADFAKFLAKSSGRPVVDESGLTGRYDISLYSSMADIQSVLVVRAVQQLGLKLETHTAPAKYIVVDKLSRIPN